MGSTFEIIFEMDRPREQLDAAAGSAFELVDQLEGELSSYIATSDIRYINGTAPERPAWVAPDLFDLLLTARQIYRETNGAFDITAGPLVRTWGFYRGEGRKPDPDELADVLDKVGMDMVHFDEKEHTVRFEKPGIEINLGAIGKGYVVDRVVALLRQWDIECAVVNSANSSIAVMGAPPETQGWPLGVADPRDPDKALGLLYLADKAMGTSGGWEQFFELDGTIYSHIIDPRSGQPARGMLATTVIGPSATITDALATAFFVMGVEEARRYCETHPDIAAVLIAGESPDEMIVHTVGCKLEKED